MRFVVRWLALIALCVYLFDRFGGPIRRTFWEFAEGQRGFANLLAGNSIWSGHEQTQVGSYAVPPGTVPRPDLTPGAIDPRVTQANIATTICRRGYAAGVRPPFVYTNAMKHKMMRRYSATGSIHDYELDHLVPLELGGCPDCEANLWPEPRKIFPGAAEKDEVEDYLHDTVCLGGIPLREAQREIASDWYAVYRRIHHIGTKSTAEVKSRSEDEH